MSIQLELIRENSVGHTLRLDVGSVISRVLAKAMWANDTVTCLDLSSNELNDHAGAYLARILKRNNVLKKMELEDIVCLRDMCEHELANRLGDKGKLIVNG